MNAFTGLHAADSGPGKELATAMATLDADSPVELTALRAAERIRVDVALLTELANLFHRRLMESAWYIRREYPEPEDFERFYRSQGLERAIGVPQAWKYAEVWEVMRKQRGLRDLAADQPKRAIAFVDRYLEAVGEKAVRELDEDDPGLAEFMSLSPKKQKERFRALNESYQERLDLEPTDPPSPPPPASQPDTPNTLAEWMSELVDAIAAVNRLATGLPGLLAEEAPGAARIQQIERQADFGIGILESVLEAVDRPGEDAGDGV